MNNLAIVSKFLHAEDDAYTLQAIADLSLKEALYVIALIRSSATISSHGHVGPIARVPPLAPACRSGNEVIVIKYLAEKPLVTFGIDTDASAFTVVNDEITAFDVKAVKWKVLLENFEVSLFQLNEIIVRSTWPLRWRHDVKAVWLEIAILECIEYLQYLANERAFRIEVTDDLQNHFLTLLRDHSVSQCFGLIREAVREVSDKVVKNTITRVDAGKTIMKYCFQRRKKLVYQEASRPYTIPQSQLSYVFHYEFLKIGEAGFTAVPHDFSLSSLS
ncbi:MAG: hypothetical protein ACXVCD_11405 [Pseudobdellovibrionaceae bacterium]